MRTGVTLQLLIVICFALNWSLIGVAAEPSRDVTIMAPLPWGKYEEEKNGPLRYCDEEIGVGREALRIILGRVAELPPETSVVWGPDFRRCGCCSPRDEGHLLARGYPDEWAELRRLVKERGLFLSSIYPGPEELVIAPPRKDMIVIDWRNYRGRETPHSEVLYLANGKLIGFGDDGFKEVIKLWSNMPKGAKVQWPRYWVLPYYPCHMPGADHANDEGRYFAPCGSEKLRVLDQTIEAHELKLIRERKHYGRDSKTVYGWRDGDRYGEIFVSVGRIVRYDEPRQHASARLNWTNYRATDWSEREPESTATYTFNEEPMGVGFDGFKQAMRRVEELPRDSVLQVRVCLRTKGPFVCPLIYKGHRHFERTGFEPYFGMLNWLVAIAERSHLKIEWVPDEAESLKDCELNL